MIKVDFTDFTFRLTALFSSSATYCIDGELNTPTIVYVLNTSRSLFPRASCTLIDVKHILCSRIVWGIKMCFYSHAPIYVKIWILTTSDVVWYFQMVPCGLIHCHHDICSRNSEAAALQTFVPLGDNRGMCSSWDICIIDLKKASCAIFECWLLRNLKFIERWWNESRVHFTASTSPRYNPNWPIFLTASSNDCVIMRYCSSNSNIESCEINAKNRNSSFGLFQSQTW